MLRDGTQPISLTHSFEIYTTSTFSQNKNRLSHAQHCHSSLHTPMDNVAHARGQRCTRPWTTLHTPECNEQSPFKA